MTAEAEFTQRLVDAVPELEPMLEEHLADQEGELLAYLFMGEVAGWLAALSEASPSRANEVLGWLEGQFTTGAFEVRNLIDVGIVEMLPAVPEGRTVLMMLPTELRSRAEVAGLFETR